MIFTQEQIDEIKKRLSLNGIKDSELDKLDLLEHPLTGKEVITIVKDGENLRISVEDLYEEFTKYIEQSGIREGFFNVSAYLGRLDPEFKNAAKPCTLREAVNASPPYIRKAGQMISFLDSYNMKWKTYQYIGTKDDDWGDIDLFEADMTVLQDRVDNLNSTVSNLQPEVQSAKTTAEEAKQIALGANRSITFATYKNLVQTLEGGSSVFEFEYGAKAKVGQNIYIAALNVPDCWIAEVDEEGRLTPSEYDTESPTFDNDIVNLLVSENGLIINNWIRLRALETQKVDLTEYDKDISNLKQNVTSNTSEIGAINTNLSAIKQDIQNNQSSILRLDNEKATKQELQNSAQGLGQAISSVGALAGSNNTRITSLEESVATNSNDISELKEGKADYTSIVNGTIIAGHALLADNAASANNAKNAQFASEAGRAMHSDTSTLATAAQTAYNVKATNIEGVLSKDQLPAYPTENSIQDINGDTLYISDSKGNVIASFNNEGLYVTGLAYKNDSGKPTDVKLIIESIINRLGTAASIIEDMYPDALYVTDASGNMLASFNKEGLKAINIPNNISNYLWNNEEFFVIGDSLSADFGTGDEGKVGWIYPFKILMGAKFDGKRNSQHISVGGTTTVQGNSLAGQMRARLLVKELNEDGIYPKHIIYENVNDVQQARLTASNSSVDNEPFMMSGNFIQDSSIPQQSDEDAARVYFDANINTILDGKTPHHGDVFMMPYKSTGVTVTINGTPTSDGVLSVIVNGNTRTLRVSTGEDIQSILDKIIENDFLFFTDMQVGNNAVSFVCTSATVQSTLEGKTAEQIAKFTFTGSGLSFTSVKDDSASASLPLGFYSHNMSDWTTASKWVKLIEIPYCAVLKGVVEYLTTSFPECELIMMIAPSFALSYDDSGIPYKYTDGSANQNKFIETKEVRCGKYIEDWKAVANMYGIKYIDVCSEWGVTCSNYATFYDSGDIHPKDKGYIAMGNVMYKNLK